MASSVKISAWKKMIHLFRVVKYSNTATHAARSSSEFGSNKYADFLRVALDAS